ncbi:MAG: hypothetical protein AAF975_05890 [Spirochaetota bacterium]
MTDEQIDRMIAAMARDTASLKATQAETSRQIQEMRQGIAELRESQAETGKQLKESQAETSRQIQELRESQAETNLQIQKMSDRLDRIGTQLRNIGIGNGAFAEEFFYQSFVESPKLGDITYDSVERNIHDGNDKTEYDILLINGTSTAVIEVKYKARLRDIEDLVRRKAAAFREGNPRLQRENLYLGLATLMSHDELVAEAHKAGIYLLTQHGTNVELVNEGVRTF